MKKFLSLLLSVILILTVITTLQVSAAGKMIFAVSNAKGEVGDTVKIEISTKNNPGIIGMQVGVEYDDTALKLKSYKEKDFKGVTYGPEVSPFIVTWIDPLKPDNSTNGVLAVLEFEILNTAPNGKSNITLICKDAENMFNAAFEDIAFDFENGYVDIKNSNPQKPSSSQQSSSTTSVDSDIDSMYEQVIEDMLNDPDNIKVESNDKNDSSEAIITDGAISNDNTNTDSNNNKSDEPTLDWLIWVVVVAVIVLGAAFVVVILKSKKGKH